LGPRVRRPALRGSAARAPASSRPMLPAAAAAAAGGVCSSARGFGMARSRCNSCCCVLPREYNTHLRASQKPDKAQAQAPLDDAYKNANPGDTATTKGILDDAVVQSFEDAGFGEDHRLSNLKLFLGALACIFALVAQVSLVFRAANGGGTNMTSCCSRTCIVRVSRLLGVRLCSGLRSDGGGMHYSFGRHRWRRCHSQRVGRYFSFAVCSTSSCPSRSSSSPPFTNRLASLRALLPTLACLLAAQPALQLFAPASFARSARHCDVASPKPVCSSKRRAR